MHAFEWMWSVAVVRSADESHRRRVYLSHHVKRSGPVNMNGVFEGECFVHNNTETVVTVAAKLSPVSMHIHIHLSERVCERERERMGCLYRKQKCD